MTIMLGHFSAASNQPLLTAADEKSLCGHLKKFVKNLLGNKDLHEAVRLMAGRKTKDRDIETQITVLDRNIREAGGRFDDGGSASGAASKDGSHSAFKDILAGLGDSKAEPIRKDAPALSSEDLAALKELKSKQKSSLSEAERAEKKRLKELKRKGQIQQEELKKLEGLKDKKRGSLTAEEQERLAELKKIRRERFGSISSAATEYIDPKVKPDGVDEPEFSEYLRWKAKKEGRKGAAAAATGADAAEKKPSEKELSEKELSTGLSRASEAAVKEASRPAAAAADSDIDSEALPLQKKSSSNI